MNITLYYGICCLQVHTTI